MAFPWMMRDDQDDQEMDAVMETGATQSNKSIATPQEVREERGQEGGKASEKLAAATAQAIVGLEGRTRA